MTEKLSRKERDILRLLHSNCHLGSQNYNVQMKRFISTFNRSGVPIFDLNQTYQRILLAARVIAGVADLKDVYAISSRESGQRAVVKFASYTDCSVTSASKWTPGSLTNYETKQFKEPKLLIIVDPHADAKPIKEASYANIPVIALCDTHSNLKCVDIAIPCNNNNTESISMIFWLLAREVLVLRGKLDRSKEWDVIVDLFYAKNMDALKDEEDEEDEEDGEDDAEEESKDKDESEEE